MLTILDTVNSYVPAFLTRRWLADPASLDRPYHHHGDCALLFADLSGFTALAERHSQEGAAGTELLTRLLNVAFGQLVEAVCAHGGDIVKFAGDALLAVWPREAANHDLVRATLRAAQAGLAIQAVLAAEAARSESPLSVRVGIGAGAIDAFQIGGLNGEWEHVLAGAALQETLRAEGAAQPEQVVLTPRAWELLRDHGVGAPLPEGGVLLHSLHVPPESLALRLPDLPPEAEKALLGRVPRAVRSRLVAGQNAWLAELRQVTVVFANLPELGRVATLDRAQAIMRALQGTIDRFEGSINKLSLDGKGISMLAAFGLPPRSHEDDPVRAVRAALALRASLAELGVEVAIGVATGRVFCGEVGNHQRREYTVIGDTVNFAARLAQQAPDDFLCDAATFEATQGRIRCEVLLPFEAKGKTGFLSVFRPLAEIKAATVPSGAIIGREEEKGFLRSALRRLHEFGEGGVLVLEGEAGFGKSILLDYLVGEARALGLTCLQGSGDSIEKSTPYLAWRPIFQRLLSPEAESDPQALLPAIVARLADDPERSRLVPLLGALLPLDAPDNEVTEQMAGQVRADNTVDLLLHLIQGACPLVIAIEDFHWLDTASWSLLRALSKRSLPVLLVTTTRPLSDPQRREYRQILELPGVQRLTLGAMAVDEALEMVCRQLGVRSLPEPVADLIRTKAEGHPFFSTELALALRDAGFIRIQGDVCHLTAKAGDFRQIDLPNTVEGLITSRVDRLPPSQQLSLKVASVIGRVFAYSTLHDTYPISADRPHLVDHLRAMEELDLTQLALREPEAIYVFKHIITQEVVYNLLLFSQRAQLHRAVAEWYETTHRSNLAPFYPLLAHHWEEAREPQQAAAYLEKSGEQALRTGAYREAIAFFDKSLALGPSTDRWRRGHQEHCLAEAHAGLGHLAEATVHVRRAMALQGVPVPRGTLGLLAQLPGLLLDEVRHYRRRCDAYPEPRERERLLEQAHLYRTLGMLHYYSNDTLGSIHSILKGKSLASKAGPSAELAVATSGLAIASGLVPNHALVATYVEKALQVLEEVDDLNLRAQTLIRISLCAVAVGNWQRAEAVASEVVAITERLGDRRQFGEGFVQLALVRRYSGDFRAAEDKYRRLYEVALKDGNDHHRSWTLDGRAIMRLRQGDYEDAHQLLAEAAALTANNPDHMERTNHLSQEALLHLRQGRREQAWSAALSAARMSALSPPSAVYAIDGLATTAEVFLSLWENPPGALPIGRAEMRGAAKRSARALQRFARLFPLAESRAWLYQGWYDWLDGDRAKARRAWTRAEAAACRLGLRFEEGLVLLERGRRGLADRAEIARAAELLDQVGATDDARRARALLEV